VLGSPCGPSVTCYTQYATCDTGVCVCSEGYTDTNGNTAGGDCSAGEQNVEKSDFGECLNFAFLLNKSAISRIIQQGGKLTRIETPSSDTQG